MSTLKINFYGICVHFRNIVPGVAHRVVLPGAMNVKLGTVVAPGWGDSKSKNSFAMYYTLPHFAFLRDPKTENGIPLLGQHLRISNITDVKPIGTADCPDTVTPSLSRYVKDAELNEDMVLRGIGAACIFDFENEPTVIADRLDGCHGAFYTRIFVDVPDGVANFEISNLPGISYPPEYAESAPLSFEASELWVGNVDYAPQDADGSFDFLLNYLVTRHGMPQEVLEHTPGMPPGKPMPLNSQILGQAMVDFGDQIQKPVQLFPFDPHMLQPFDVTIACSDSNWP